MGANTTYIPSNVTLIPGIPDKYLDKLNDLFGRMSQSPAAKILIDYLNKPQSSSMNSFDLNNFAKKLSFKWISQEEMSNKGRRAYFEDIESAIYISDISFESRPTNLNELGQQASFEWVILHEIGHYLQGKQTGTPGYNDVMSRIESDLSFLYDNLRIGKIDYATYVQLTSSIANLDNHEKDATEFANLMFKMIRSGPTADFDYYLEKFPGGASTGGVLALIDYAAALPSVAPEDVQKLKDLMVKLKQPKIMSADSARKVLDEIERISKEKNIEIPSQARESDRLNILNTNNGNLSSAEIKYIRDKDGNIESILKVEEVGGKLVVNGVIKFNYELDQNGNKVKDEFGNVRPPLGFVHDQHGISSYATYALGTNRVADIDVLIPGNPIPLDFSQLGNRLGSMLGYRLANGDAISGAIMSAGLQTVADAIGDTLDGIVSGGSLGEAVKRATDGVLPELRGNLQSSAIGAVSSFLISQFIDVLGIDGFAAELVNSAGGVVINQIITNLTRLGQHVVGGAANEVYNAFTGINPQLLVNAVGSFLGQKLASKVISFQSVGGQIGSSLGSGLAVSVGTYLSITQLGFIPGLLPVAALAFVGFIVGGLIGSLFGGTPRSGADVGWSEADGRFAVSNVYSRKGGSKEAARSVATAVADTFNGVIDAVGGSLLDPGLVQSGNYGMRKSDFVYRPVSTRDRDAITRRFSGKDAADRLISYGVYQGLSDRDFQIVGGDVYIKRALYRTIETTVDDDSFDVSTLVGNLSVGLKFKEYLENKVLIDSILQSDHDSPFSAETAINLVRAVELGLNKRHRSDWFGGFSFRLSEAGVNASAVAFSLDRGAYGEKLSRYILFGKLVLSDPIDVNGQIEILADDTANTIDLRQGYLANQIGYTVNGHLNDDIAISGTDFVPRSGIAVNFAANSLRQTALLQVTPNVAGEKAEYFDVALDSSPDMVIMGPPAQVMIAPEGTGPYLMVGRSYAAEGEGYAIFQISLSKALNAGESVALSLALEELKAKAGVDYDAVLQYATSATATSWTSGSTLSFTAGGATQYYVRVPVKTDNGVDGAGKPTGIEGNETFRLNATVTAGGSYLANGTKPVSGIGTIIDASQRQAATGGGYKPFVWVDDFVIHGSGTANPYVTGLIGIGRSSTSAAAASVIWSNADRRKKVIDIAATVDAGGGNDTVHASDLGDNVFGGAGDDTLYGGRLDDWLLGGEGNDILNAGAADAAKLGGDGNYLDGGAGNDQLVGREGSDWLEGGDGTDSLTGGDGDDILAGGAGTDTLNGGTGADQYLFRRGDGVDVASDAGNATTTIDPLWTSTRAKDGDPSLRNWTAQGIYSDNGAPYNGEDRVVFGIGIGLADLVLQRSGMDLVIKLTKDEVLTSDQLTLTGWFDSTKRVEWLEFADGQAIRIGDFVSFTVGTNEPDAIIGTNGSDFVVGGGGGDYFELLGGDDIGLGGTGDDKIGGGDQRDTLIGGSGDDFILGGRGDDVLSGDGGADDINGGEGNDLITGGRGNDFLAGGQGNDLFKVSRGDGRDIIIDDFAGTWEVVHTSAGGWNAAQGFVWDQASNKVTRNGEVIFDGANWLGYFNYDYNTQTQAATLYRLLPDAGGRVGKDGGTLAGGMGDSDVLEFGLGINIQDLTLRRVGNDLLVGIGTENGADLVFASMADQINLKDWFSYGGWITSPIEGFAFAATGTLNMTEIKAALQGTDGNDTIAGYDGRDWMTGGAGDDVISGLGGDDILNGNAGQDTLNGGAGDDILYGGAGDDIIDGGLGKDIIVGGAGNDTVSFAGMAEVAGQGVQAAAFLQDASLRAGDAEGDSYTAVESLSGSGFNDVLGGDDGDNILWGGAGAANDRLYGGKGNDVYVFEPGNGADIIADGSYTLEEIVVNGALKAGYTANWIASGTVTEAGVTRYKYRLQVIRTSGNETVYDSDLFLYETQQSAAPPVADWAPDGWIRDAVRVTGGKVSRVRLYAGGEGGDDTLELGQGLSLADLSFAWSGGDLVISTGAGNAVTLRNQTTATMRIETLQLADGLAADLTRLKLGGDGGADDDVVIGTAGNDVLNGLAGNDIISGGAGDDVLTGSDGDDVLEGGAGADTLTGDAGMDTVRYASSSAAVTVDLTLATAQAGGDAAGDLLSGIENVVGSVAGADTLTGDAANNRLFGLDGDDTLYGNAGDDVLVGGAGLDNLYGGDGADNISGDDGNDKIWGGNGNDLIDGGAGNNTINGDAGDDQLVGGSGNDFMGGGADNDRLSGNDGNDILDGNAGDDVLVGGSGNDLLRGSQGNDSYLFSANSGTDTIVDQYGANTIQFDASVDHRDIWFSRAAGSDDLVIGVIGGNSRIIVQGYYAPNSPGLMRSIATSTHALYLAHAQPLIEQMSAIALGAPPARVIAVAAAQTGLWWEGGNARPSVQGLELTVNEDEASGLQAFGAIDHDGNITGYSVRTAPGKGAVTLDAATGSFSYQPNANIFGDDSFVLTVTDANGNQADKTVKVRILPVNDAPSDIVLTLDPGVQDGVPENLGDSIVIGTLAAIDVDRPEDSDFGQSKLTVSDWRFEIVGNVLRMKALAPGSRLDYEREPVINLVVKATDRNGAGLAFSKTLQIPVKDLVDYKIGTPNADSLNGAQGMDDIQGLDGDDKLYGGLGNDRLDGGNGKDTLSGEGGDDTLIGGAGDDIIFGHAGVDLVNAGSENDAVFAGDGNDVVNGDTGNDILYGEAGDDVLNGGDGDDTLFGGAGADQLNGAAGFDIVDYSRSSYNTNTPVGVTVDLANMAANTGDAAGDSFSGIEGVQGTVQADILRGDVGNNQLFGIAGNDEIDGGAGDDYIDGGVGNDILYGGDGNDLLVGGVGNDIMTGGAGNDTYIVNRSSGADTINNYHTNTTDNDVLGFQDAIADSELWFQKSGNDLIISVIGTTTSTRIKDWYLTSTVTEQTNYKIKFIEAGVSRVINAEGLVGLMTGRTRPATKADHDALMASDVTYREAWNSFWGENPAPIVSAIANQSLAEDVAKAITITATDTHDGTVPTEPNTLIMIAKIYDPVTGAEITDGSRIVVSFGAANAQGQRTMTLTPAANFFGSARIRIWAADPGGRYSEERSFDVSIDAKADMPTIEATTSAGVNRDNKGSFHAGATIPLNLDITFPDGDGSETHSIIITGVPSGVTLNRGVQAGTTWTLTEADLTGLALVGPAGWSSDISLGVKARAVETSNGNMAETAVKTILVDVNAAPTDIVMTGTIKENSAFNTGGITLGAVDPDGGAFTYELLTNPYNRFAINATTGAVTVLTNDPAQINFETAGLPANAVTVRVTDNGGLTFTKTFNLAIADENERPAFGQNNYTFAAISEWATAGTVVGTVSATDPDTLNATYGAKKYYFQNAGGATALTSPDVAGGSIRLSNISDDGMFQIDVNSGQITLRSALNYEAKSSYAHTVVVTDGITGGGARVYGATVSIAVKDENEAPTLTLNTPTLVIDEQPDNVMMWRWQPVTATDPDTNAAYRTLYYKLAGANADYFLINSQTGQLALQKPLDYDNPNDPKSFNLTVQVWDGGSEGVGNYASKNFTVNVNDVNEVPTLRYSTVIKTTSRNIGGEWTWERTFTATALGSDDDLRPGWGGPLRYEIKNAYAYNGAQITPPALTYINGGVQYIFDYDYRNSSAWRSEIWVYDQSNLASYVQVDFSRPTGAMSPIIFDLNGDGVGLTSMVDNGIRFDMDGDGKRDVTGWVGVDDGLLALDLNGDGLVDHGSEISFTAALPGAVSDLEGLRAYDSNGNGFLDAGDARFGEFKIWQDLNQDGVSQANELRTLAQQGIAAINLTLGTINPAANADPMDNRIHGYSEFIRSDGSTGKVGDVFLSYVTESEGTTQIMGEHRGLIGIDLDGGGVALSGLRGSPVAFDMAANGGLRSTGWVGAGDAMLAIDLDGDGAITSGRELSLGDGDGLSPLDAYDSNHDGVVDMADTRFGDFRVWQDLNQDGISQAGELCTLLQAGIARIALPGSPGSFNAAAGESLAYGAISIGMVNGEAGSASSVLLAYDETDLGTLAPPIIVNWDGDDKPFVGLGASSTRFDMNGDGVADRTSWLDQGDAFLALDRNGNGKVDGIGEISFVKDKAGAKTDLEGLRGFDTNGDGKLTAADEKFGQFKLWFDNNSNGQTEVGELLSLTDLGVAAIDLVGDPKSPAETVAGNRIYNRTRLLKADGTAIGVLDVGLSYLPSSSSGGVAGGVANTDGLPPPAGVSEEALPKLTPANRSYDRKASKYRLTAMGGSLYVAPKKANGKIDERAGLTGASTMLSFKNGSYGLLTPITLDLDGDGLELKSIRKAKAAFDMNGDSIADDTGWTGKGDGFLVIDRNGDGKITGASELSFLAEKADAKSDLDALATLDANKDGKLDAKDARFGELKVWLDGNGNGVTDEGELKSLADHGIASIGLSGQAVNQVVKVGDNAVLATGIFTRTDGSTGTFGDTALAYRPGEAPPGGTMGGSVGDPLLAALRAAIGARPDAGDAGDQAPSADRRLALMTQAMAALGANAGGEIGRRLDSEQARYDYFA